MRSYYGRSQVQKNGITPERAEALLFFLWGTHGREGAENKEAYDCDKLWLDKMLWTPVDIHLELKETQ